MNRVAKVALGCLGVAGGWIFLLMLFLAIWQFLSPERPPITQVAYSEFRALMLADPDKEPHVERATLKGREIAFWVKDPKADAKTKRVTIGPERTDELAREMADHHIAVTFEEEEADAAMTRLGMALFSLLFFLSGLTGFSWMKLWRTRKELAQANAEVARLKTLLALA